MDKVNSSYKRGLQMLSDAKYNFSGGRFVTSIHNSYYAVFHVSKALVRKKGLEVDSHEGNVTFFGKEYVSKGDFDNKIAKILSELKIKRSKVQYDDSVNPTQADAKIALEKAEEFIKECEKYL